MEPVRVLVDVVFEQREHPVTGVCFFIARHPDEGWRGRTLSAAEVVPHLMGLSRRVVVEWGEPLPRAEPQTGG